MHACRSRRGTRTETRECSKVEGNSSARKREAIAKTDFFARGGGRDDEEE